MRVDRRIRFERATCEQGNFSIRKETVTDSKYPDTNPSLSFPYLSFVGFRRLATLRCVPTPQKQRLKDDQGYHYCERNVK